MTRPAGSVSLKPTPVSAVVVFGFVMVKLARLSRSAECWPRRKPSESLAHQLP